MQLDGVFSRLRQFDAYSKPQQDFTVRTIAGGVVSVVAAAAMLILFLLELSYYLTIDTTQDILVDLTAKQKINITFNITMPAMPCSLLTVDAMDVTGSEQHDIFHDVYKTRLDTRGQPLSDDDKTITNLGTTVPPSDCGDCYGAANDKIKCCNTCEQVKEAYRQKGWRVPDLETISQCKTSNKQQHVDVTDGQGCRLDGFISVNKVAGNLHLAPGRTHKESHSHIHDMQGLMDININSSHIIDYLAFGHTFPDRRNPLDNTRVISNSHWVTYKYYVKVVPTTYVYLNGTTVESNQFSVTVHTKTQDNPMLEKTLPGVFFVYEITPMMVRYTEKQRSTTHFITSVCAIVGGVFTVAGIIDSLLYNSFKLYKKHSIGKAT